MTKSQLKQIIREVISEGKYIPTRKNIADYNQYKILIDIIKNPNKALFGNISVKDAEKSLMNKFRFTKQDIQQLTK